MFIHQRRSHVGSGVQNYLSCIRGKREIFNQELSSVSVSGVVTRELSR